MNVVILTILSVNIYFHLYCILSDMHWLGFKCQTLFLLSLYVNLFFSLAFSAVVFDDCAGNESVEFDVSNPDFLIDENLNLVPRRDVIDSGDVMFVHGVNVHVDDMAQVTIMGAPSRSPQTLRVSFYLWVDFVCVCVCVCVCVYVCVCVCVCVNLLNGLKSSILSFSMVFYAGDIVCLDTHDSVLSELDILVSQCVFTVIVLRDTSSD